MQNKKLISLINIKTTEIEYLFQGANWFLFLFSFILMLLFAII